MVARAPNNFPGLHNRLWGNALVGGLDCGTFSMSRVAGGGMPSIVVYGPDFEKIYTGGECYKGSWYMKGPGNPPVNYVALKEGLGKVGNKGIFGGLKVPDAARRLVPVIKAAQLSNALRGLKTLPGDGDTGAFKTEVTKRIEALRDRKKKIFEDLEKAGDKWGAFKAGSSYTRVFPTEKDTSAIRSKVGKLQWDADVKKQIMAQQTFQRLVPMIYGPRRNPAAVKQKAQLFKQLVERFKGTEFADLAAKLADTP